MISLSPDPLPSPFLAVFTGCLPAGVVAYRMFPVEFARIREGGSVGGALVEESGEDADRRVAAAVKLGWDSGERE